MSWRLKLLRFSSLRYIQEPCSGPQENAMQKKVPRWIIIAGMGPCTIRSKAEKLFKT